MTTLLNIRRNALASLIPPPRLRLSDWIESNVRSSLIFVNAVGLRARLSQSEELENRMSNGLDHPTSSEGAKRPSWTAYPLYAFAMFSVGPSLIAPILYVALQSFGVTELSGGGIAVQADMIFLSPIFIAVANLPFLVLYRVCKRAVIREWPSVRSVRLGMWCSLIAMSLLGIWFSMGFSLAMLSTADGQGIGLGSVLELILLAIFGGIGWLLGRGIAALRHRAV